ncbi:hypothetical protein ACLX1H_007937 [Fusarium chlamydosporum]
MAEVLGVASSVIAVVDLSAKVFSLCLQYYREVKNAKVDIEKLREEVATFQTTAKELQTLVEGPRGKELKVSQQLTTAIKDGRSRLEDLEKQLQPSTRRKRMSRLGIHAIKWPFESKEVKRTIEDLERYRGSISLALNIDQIAILQNVDDRTTLNQLPIAHGASFDSKAEEYNPTCLPNTRTELLRQIDGWIDDPKSKTIFWLDGKAGTGKSTISRTVARSQSKQGNLGASFFFKRGEIDRGNLDKFVPTLAYQLALSIPGVAFFIKSALDANISIVEKSVREQFAKLIQEPLSAAAATAATPSSVVMVIDALDECNQEADIRTLISIFSQIKILRLRLRIFLTSRPELAIRLGFSKVQGSYQDLVLHEIPAQIVEHDIFVFLDDELSKIRHDFNMTVGDERKLSPNWPGVSTVQRLSQMAVPLFIFAATVCRFIGDRQRRKPRIRLQTVLDHGNKSHGSQLDQTYAPILYSQINELTSEEREEVIRDFKLIVGSIVTLASPLSVTSLSRLINVLPDVVDERLDALHSVLSVPLERTSPVRLLHLSFRDYLIDPENRETLHFCVDEKVTHQGLANHCLRIMRSTLHENICSLSFPGTRRSTLNNSELEDKMAGEPRTSGPVYFCGRCGAIPSDQFLRDLGSTTAALFFLSDFCTKQERFEKDIRRYHSKMDNEFAESPRTLGCMLTDSRGPYWHYNLCSVLARLKKASIGLLGQDDTNLGRGDRSVVFSHDSKKLASASDDKTIRIWDVEMGDCEQTLEGHNDKIRSVVFSHDSRKVASACDDKTVWIWDAETGEHKQTLEGHGDRVRSVVFSHDSMKLASASFDKTIRVWNAETGICEQALEGHSDVVTSAVFSHNLMKLASASFDKTIRIWDATTGVCEDATSLDVYTNVLSFTFDEYGIITDNGVFGFSGHLTSGATTPVPLHPSKTPVLACKDSIWVTTRGKDLLWLPPECRNGEAATAGSTVALVKDRLGRGGNVHYTIERHWYLNVIP